MNSPSYRREKNVLLSSDELPVSVTVNDDMIAYLILMCRNDFHYNLYVSPKSLQEIQT